MHSISLNSNDRAQHPADGFYYPIKGENKERKMLKASKVNNQ